MGISQPLVSVLVPCRNAAGTILDTIKSLESQTFRDFEVVAVDDGSSDETARMLSELSRRLSFLRVHTIASSGLPSALNQGMLLARGQWIARLDADDTAEPDRLARQVDASARTPHAVLIGSDCHFCDERLRPVCRTRYPSDHRGLVRRMRVCKPIFPHSSVFFRRDIALDIGGYRQVFRRAQDLDLFLRLAERGVVRNIRRPLVNIRRHDRQISRESDGQNSFVFARAAAICSEIRRLGAQDPLGDGTDEAMPFIQWVRQQVQQLGEFDRRRIASQAAFMLKKPSGPGDLLNAISVLWNECASVRGLAWQRLFGSSFPRRMAREWLLSQSAGSQVIRAGSP